MEIVILLFYLLTTGFASYCLLGALKNAGSEKCNKNYTVNSVILIVFGFIMLISSSFGAKYLPFDNIRTFTNILMSVTAFELLIYIFVVQYAKAPVKHIFTVLVKTVLAALIIETVVFNYQSFFMIFDKYQVEQIPVTQENMSNFVYQNGNWSSDNTGNNPTINIGNINKKTGSLYFDVELANNTPYVDVDVEYGDDTNAEVRAIGASIRIVNGVENSAYMRIEASGNLQKLRIFFKVPAGQYILLKGITANKPLPYDFSLLRVALAVLIILSVYALKNLTALKKPLCENKKIFSGVCYIVMAAFIVLSLVITYQFNNDGFNLKSQTGNQETQELVDAFKKGNISLDVKPAKELLEMNNPYDWSERIEKNVPASWDHVLYNGKYYSCYGIAPVLLFFLPYNLITGYYFHSISAVWLFSGLGMFFLTKLYLALMNRRFGYVSVRSAICGFIVLISTSGTLYACCRGLFYEICTSSGFACAAASAFFLVTSNVLYGDKIKYSRLTAAAILSALAVLCRATFALYCIATLVAMAFGFFRQKKLENPHNVRYILLALTPFAVLGSVQMAYNYLRFGSIFDFGINYSVTMNDFTHTQFNLLLVIAVVFNYLFNIPHLVPEFPYIQAPFRKLGAKAFFFVDDAVVQNLAVGLFFKALPMFGYFGIRKAYSKMEPQTRKRDMLFLIVYCVVVPLIIICTIWKFGYAVRYYTDFAWQMLLGAYVILFVAFVKNGDKKTVKRFDMFMIISAFVALFITASQIHSFAMNMACFDGKIFYATLEYIFKIIR